MIPLVAVLAVKAALATLLIVAGLSKLADRAAFQRSLALFTPRRMPPGLRPTLAAAIAGIEIVVGGLSLLQPRLIAGDVGVLALCVAFAVVSLIGVRYHRGQLCRCFGSLADHRFGPASVARSVVLGAGAGVVVVGHGMLAAIPLPTTAEWGLVLLALVPTLFALVLAGQVLRVARVRVEAGQR
jgi:hypothetical protein